MDATEYDNIARVEATHWWYKGMAAISLSLLRPYLPAHLLSHILDAGCGTGGMLLKLAALGQPIGLNFNPLHLAYA